VTKATVRLDISIVNLWSVGNENDKERKKERKKKRKKEKKKEGKK
jgi:hypothetical protein